MKSPRTSNWVRSGGSGLVVLGGSHGTTVTVGRRWAASVSLGRTAQFAIEGVGGVIDSTQQLQSLSAHTRARPRHQSQSRCRFMGPMEASGHA